MKEIVKKYIEMALRERIAKECPGYGPWATDDVVRASLASGGVTKETLYRAIELAAKSPQEAA